MNSKTKNALVILGPTATGKTALGAGLASLLDGEILSADSRQVYRGLDIGAGKDLKEYIVQGRSIPYHLIDIVDLNTEFSVFHYQQVFYKVYEDVLSRSKLPVIVGGTGMYLDAVLCGYRLVPTPENLELREKLELLDDNSLKTHLFALQNHVHNKTDTEDRNRIIRAIEIAEYSRDHPAPPVPAINALILGIACEPDILRQRIARRLKQRMDAGLIAEVEKLHALGYTWERLELLGLEYRCIAEYLQGKINSRNDLFQKLNSAIAQFSKRQRTWFRRMERQGTYIHWLPDNSVDTALQVIRGCNFARM